MRGLKDKVVIVTGGAGGIGEATVRRLLSEGAKVVFADWNLQAGNALQQELGDAARFIMADVSDEDACQKVVAFAKAQFGAVDVLVNNAGIRNYQPVAETDAEGWQRILGVNLMSYVYCSKAAIPEMTATGRGAIVNVASIRSILAGENTVQYDTAKAAILGLTRSTARDYAASGIRANAVGPGPIYTPFHQGRAKEQNQSEDEYRTAFGAKTMLKRPADPSEVASAIAFLASEDASYITGTCLFVDGGITASGD